jgi:hypothetical protein
MTNSNSTVVFHNALDAVRALVTIRVWRFVLSSSVDDLAATLFDPQQTFGDLDLSSDEQQQQQQQQHKQQYDSIPSVHVDSIPIDADERKAAIQDDDNYVFESYSDEDAASSDSTTDDESTVAKSTPTSTLATATATQTQQNKSIIVARKLDYLAKFLIYERFASLDSKDSAAAVAASTNTMTGGNKSTTIGEQQNGAWNDLSLTRELTDLITVMIESGVFRQRQSKQQQQQQPQPLSDSPSSSLLTSCDEIYDTIIERVLVRCCYLLRDRCASAESSGADFAAFLGIVNKLIACEQVWFLVFVSIFTGLYTR